jgi:hypothetical protein
MSSQAPEWIDWNGGSAPVTDVLVEVRLRYGRDVVRAQGHALRWSHDLYAAYGADDIVAYRVIAALAG